MAIFADLQFESIIQVDDKLRLDASSSFVSKDEAAVTLIRIRPSAADSFIDVTGASSDDWFLDWSYSTDGNKTVTVEITTDGAPVTKDFSLTAVTEADDALFSTDADIRSQETDILKWLPKGKNSFTFMHRKSQELILAYLDETGVTDSNGDRLTKDRIVDVEEVRQWSTALTLRLIFQDLSNAVDDIFDRKSQFYAQMESTHKERSILRFDFDGDGTIEDGEFARFRSTPLFRR